jgi:DNA replication protein DnaC
MYDLSKIRPSIRSQIRRANLPSSTIGLQLPDLDPYQGKVLDVVESWIDKLKRGEIVKADGRRNSGKGLLLIGAPGQGKTTLASVILQKLLLEASSEAWSSHMTLERPAYFTDYPTLLRSQQRAFDKDETYQDLIDSVFGEGHPDRNVRLLVVDDLGKEHRTASGWAEHTFDALLRRRFSLGLPTIVTTNVPLSSWAKVYGESMASFANEAFAALEVVSPGGDRRL